MRIKVCAACRRQYVFCHDSHYLNACSEECFLDRKRAQRRHQRRVECVRKWSDAKVEDFLLVLVAERDRRQSEASMRIDSSQPTAQSEHTHLAMFAPRSTHRTRTRTGRLAS